MASDQGTIKGSASMWALSNDKETVRFTVPSAAAPGETMPLRVEFDRTSLEATLAMLVQLHFEMMRRDPAQVRSLRH